MSGFRLLDLVKPFVPLLVEVELPYERLTFDEKVLWTVFSAAIFLLTGLPLYGVKQDTVADPFSWLRLPFGGFAGSLLEFGVLPVITSAFLWQALAGLRLVKVNFELRSDRELFQSLQKLTSVVLAIIYSVLLVLAGYYEPATGLSASVWTKVIIVLQLSFATFVTALLVEVLDKGYGFGPGALAFVSIGAASRLAGDIIGLSSYATSRGWESQGALVQLVRNIRTKPFTNAIYDSFTRASFANLSQVYITLIALLAAIYVSNCRTELPIKSAKVRAMASVYPIKLAYCGALPLVFTYALLFNLNIFGFTLVQIFKSVPQTAYVGVWEIDPFTGLAQNLSGGVLYFLSSSSSGSSALAALARPFTFGVFIVLVSVLFARVWTGISGSSGRDLAKQFKEQDIALIGHRDVAVTRELNKIIPVAAATGAAIIGLVVAISENLGSRGESVSAVIGLLSALTILEGVATEWQQTGGQNSQIGQAFGQQ